MILRASRLRAIINNISENPDLKNQNRTLWDKRMIEEGIMYLEKSASGCNATEYHLRAGICACHSLAKDYRSTNWKRILSLYSQYLEINYSLEIELERAKVISDIEGPKAAIDALLRIDTRNNPNKSNTLNSTLAELYIMFHEYKEAMEHFSKCLELTNDEKEQSIYLNKIEFCKQQLELKKKYNLVLSF